MPTLAEVQSRQLLSRLSQSRVLSLGQESLHPLIGNETFVTSDLGNTATLADWVALLDVLPNIVVMTQAEYDTLVALGTDLDGRVYVLSDVPPLAPPMDGLSVTPTAAFSSSRALFADYTGSFFTLTDSKVSQFTDQSGNGRHLTKTVASDRPVLSYCGQHHRRSVFFDGTQDYLEGNPLVMSDFIDADNTYVICTFLPQNISSEDATLYENSALWEDASLNMGVVIKGTIGTNTPQLYGHGRNSAFTRITSDTSFDCTNDRPRVVEWKHANSKLYIRIDGESWIENAVANYTGTAVSALGFDFQLGGSGGTTTFYYGHIVEFATFAGTLPTTQEQDDLRANFLTHIGSDVTWINWEYWPAGELKELNPPNTMLWYKQCNLGYNYDVRIHPSRTFIRFIANAAALCPVIDSDAIFGRSRAEINTPAGTEAHAPDSEFYLYFGHRIRPGSANLRGYFGQFHDQRSTGVDADPPLAWWIEGSTLQIQVRGSAVDPLPFNPPATVLYEDTTYPLDGSTVLWFAHVIFATAETGTIEIWRSDNDGVLWTKVVDRQADVSNMYAGSTGVYFKCGIYTYTETDVIGIDFAMPKLELDDASDYRNNPIIPQAIAWDY